MTRSLLNHFKSFGCVVILASVAMASTLTITVVPSIGPSGLSPSYDQYVSNAEYALENNLSSYGQPGPSAYSAASSPIDLANIIETDNFNSWLGVTPPPTGYGNELGNNLYYGLVVTSDTPFLVSDVTFNDTLLGPGYWNTATPFTGFDAAVIGTPDGVTFYSDSTHNSDPITTLYSVGFSDYFWETSADPAQLALDANGLWALGNVNGAASGTYTLGDTSQTVTLDATTPEPATLALAGLTLGVILLFGKRPADRSK